MNKKKKSTNTSPYPDEVIDRLARAFYPAILACWNSEEGQRSLVGARPLHLANARPFGRLKAPLGLSLLRCAAQTRAYLMAGGTGSSHYQQRETERSRRGTPCCTYRYRMWLLAGCVRVDAPCFCVYFYHHINLRCCCHSNRQRKMNLINCLAVGYSRLTATNKELSVY